MVIKGGKRGKSRKRQKNAEKGGKSHVAKGHKMSCTFS